MPNSTVPGKAPSSDTEALKAACGEVTKLSLASRHASSGCVGKTSPTRTNRGGNVASFAFAAPNTTEKGLDNCSTTPARKRRTWMWLDTGLVSRVTLTPLKIASPFTTVVIVVPLSTPEPLLIESSTCMLFSAYKKLPPSSCSRTMMGCIGVPLSTFSGCEKHRISPKFPTCT